MSQKKCNVCGAEFTPTHPNSKSCSDECRYRRRLVANAVSRRLTQKRNTRPFELKEQPCKECGKLFLPTSSVQVYCSTQCRVQKDVRIKLAIEHRARRYRDAIWGEEDAL